MIQSGSINSCVCSAKSITICIQRSKIPTSSSFPITSSIAIFSLDVKRIRIFVTIVAADAQRGRMGSRNCRRISNSERCRPAAACYRRRRLGLDAEVPARIGCEAYGTPAQRQASRTGVGNRERMVNTGTRWNAASEIGTIRCYWSGIAPSAIKLPLPWTSIS